MAKLHYNRWAKEFTLDEFTAESSMRDYLKSNPSVIFEEDEWVVSIWEEEYLPESTRSDQSRGRIDLMLCRLPERAEVRSKKSLTLSDVDAWVIELKNTEASFENGFWQLYDYLYVASVPPTKERVKSAIKEKVASELRMRPGDLNIMGEPKLYGCLVASAFDLLGRTALPLPNVKAEFKQHWDNMADRLVKRIGLQGGFTLADAADVIDNVALVQLLRFSRSDETIFYTDHVLGSRSRSRTARIDPVAMFTAGAINTSDSFFFRDINGKDHSDIACRVLRGRAESHAFKVEILPTPLLKDVPFPIRGKEGFEQRSLPTHGSDKNCSKALHVALGILSEGEANARYWELGANNFVRSSDGKTLASLREGFRSTN